MGQIPDYQVRLRPPHGQDEKVTAELQYGFKQSVASKLRVVPTTIAGVR